MTESPSTGSGGSLPSFVMTAFLYIVREILRPHTAAIQSSHFIQPYIPTGYEPGLTLNPLLSPTVHRLKLLSQLYPIPALFFLRVNG